MTKPYSKSNFRLSDLLSAIFLSLSKSEEILIDFFKKLTGKKYILLTNSCRSALFLAYSSIEKSGEVITSPLTCKVAIDPIKESGNLPVYADVNIKNLNINPTDISHRISKSTIAVQVIHLGGNSCNMDEISEIARQNNLYIIEDCAQSLGAKYNNKFTGSYGDISCFSLIKNAYGIGGGVFCTDIPELYKKAKARLSEYRNPKGILIAYRIIRSLLDDKRNYVLFNKLYKALLKVKGSKKAYYGVKQQLTKISSLEKRIAAVQMRKLNRLHYKRKMIGRYYVNLLSEKKLLINNGFDITRSSFTKVFLYNPLINSQKLISHLQKFDIEAMHLEQKNESSVQERLVSAEIAQQYGLVNYNQIHDHLVSLPLSENFNETNIRNIVTSIEEYIKS